LKSLPKTLDETYEHILLAIDEEYRDMAIAALRWLCFSVRVMTIEELAEAAIFSANVQAPSEEAPFEVFFDVGDRIQDPLDILGILSGLVVYIQPSNLERTPPDSAWNPEKLTWESQVVFSHFSVKEYLVSGRLGNQVDQFIMDERCADEMLATSCLHYILYSRRFVERDDFALSPRFRPNDTHKNYTTPPLLYYASKFWVYHARKVAYESDLAHLIVSLFGTEKSVIKWLILHDSWFDRGICKTLTSIYLASMLDLYWPCKVLVEAGADVNIEGGNYGSPLQAAASNGNGRIVQFLLDHGANVNIHGEGEEKYGHALYNASRDGHERIVRLLLNSGADVNQQGGEFNTALLAAIYKGNKSIVRLLLDHGADPNIEGGVNAFSAAMHKNYPSIAILLLERGAVVPNFLGGTEAEETLARKDFKRFVAIQIEERLKLWKGQKERRWTKKERILLASGSKQ
jgi:Ankyrin repeats (3 copies)/Ankyrin repeat